MAHKIHFSYDNNNSYWRVCDPINVLHAALNTIRGKRGRYDVKRLLENGFVEAITDVWELLDKRTYVPSPYQEKTINDGKERHLKIAPLMPDRIIHHCLIDVVEADFKRFYIANTYACIKGRGIHACVRDLNRALQRDKANTRYCLKTDIHHYYDSINHAILKAIIAHFYGDKSMLWLMYIIIDSTEGDGLPIGFLTSQHFANLYLTPFDHWVEEWLKPKVKELFGTRLRYWRYMDDKVFTAGTKPALHWVKEQVDEYLQSKLKLHLKGNWQIFPVDARSIDFCGYKSNHYNTLCRKSILSTYWRKLRKVQQRYGIIDPRGIRTELAAHYGWLQHCTKEHFDKILQATYQQIVKRNTMSLQRLHVGLRSEKPQPTFDVIDRIKGTTLYNFNQHYVEVEADEANAGNTEGGKAKAAATKKVNEYSSLLVDYPVTANTILRTMIEAKYGASVESKLINDYNAACAGIEDESKKAPYLQFLSERKALRAMIDADCTANNLPLN